MMEEHDEEMEGFAQSYNQTEKKRNDLFLDTNGTCFLCLKELSLSPEYTDENKNVQQTSEVSLRYICRYLGINECSILLKTLEENVLNDKESAESVMDKCDFSVPLCFSCSVITGKLSTLLRQVEMAKMQINHQLHLMQNILQMSQSQEKLLGGTTGSTSLRPSTMGVSENSLDVRLVKNLRRETCKKCLSKLKHIAKTGIPRVRVHRLKSELQVDQSLSSLPSSSENGPITSSSDFSATFQAKRQSNDESNANTASTTNCFNNPINPKSFSSKEQFVLAVCTELVKEVPINSNKRLYNCLACNSSKELFSESIIFQHLANIHPEKFFQHEQPPHLSEESFQISCRETLASAVASSRAWVKKHPIFSGVKYPIVVCQFCNLKSGSNYAFKYHLILKHYSIVENLLSEKVNEFAVRGKQETEPREEGTMEINSSITKGIGSDVKLLSPQRLLLPCEKGSGNVFCSDKKVSYLSQQPSMKTVSISQATTTWDHLGNVTSYATNEQFVLATLAKLCKRSESEDSYHCLVCSLNELHPKFTIDKHLISVHPEMFFRYIKPPNLSESAFQTCCREVMALEVTESRRWAKKSVLFCHEKYPAVICQFCKERSANAYYFKFHFISMHHSIVEQKICTEIQKYIFKEKQRTRLEGNIKRTPDNSTNSLDNLEAGYSGSNEFGLTSFSPIMNENANQTPKKLNPVEQKLFEMCESGTIKKGQYKCPFCKYPINAHESGYKRHLVNVHFEQFLLNAKLSLVSDVAFKDCCDQILKTEKSQATQQSQLSRLREGLAARQNKLIMCPYCNRSCVNAEAHKYHIILKHSKILEEKIVEYQQRNEAETDAEPQVRTKQIFMPMSNVLMIPKNERFVSEWTCNNCEENFESEMDLLNHNKFMCRIESDPLEGYGNSGEAVINCQQDTGSSFNENRSDHHDDDNNPSSFTYMEQSFGVSTGEIEEDTKMLDDYQNYNEMVTGSSEQNGVNYDMEVDYAEIDVKPVPAESES